MFLDSSVWSFLPNDGIRSPAGKHLLTSWGVGDALQASAPVIYWNLTRCLGGSPFILCCMWSLMSSTIECDRSGRLKRGANPAAVGDGKVAHL